VRAVAQLGKTGVDEQTGMLLGYEDGALALLSCAVRTDTPGEARIDGTKGRIRIPQFWHASSAVLEVEGERPVHVSGKSGYHYQAEAVMNHLRSGELESSVMPWSESLAVARTMDEVRARIGLHYPMERADGGV
jgi:predicted dehydrogenase